MIWVLLLLFAPDWSNQVGIVGHPLAHYHLCSGKADLSAALKSKILLSEDNQYNLNIAENNRTHSQINLWFDSNATAILVFQIIVQSAFDTKTLNNDINLLELKSEAVFKDYLQLTCLWQTNNKKLPNRDVFAKEVGWGFSHRDVLSSTQQQITMAIASEVTFLNSNLLLLNKELQKLSACTNKFCDDFETSVCRGDSGGVVSGWGVMNTTKVRKCHWPAFWLVVCPWYGMHHCQS